jgi:threonine synthase
MSVRYKSTRGGVVNAKFEEVVLGGLAIDGGLYIPENIPQFSKDHLEKVSKLFCFKLH